MCEQDKEDNPKGKASRVETVLYINGERYIEVVVTDYYGNVVFKSIYKQ